MIYITGDTHRDFQRIISFCDKHCTTKDDIMIILGDAGINYYQDQRDERVKHRLSKVPITLFCIHGNHECRPTRSMGYDTILFHGGLVYVQSQYQNLLFAKDGEVYDFAGNKCLVCGGAYSVDKHYRLGNGMHWFSDEKPSAAIKEAVMNKLFALDNEIDIFLSHTCPLRYRPIETFLPCIDQSGVDVSVEYWFEKIEQVLKYKYWYCGHYHINKTIDKMRFLFDDIIAISPDDQESKLAESEAKSIA